MITDVYERWEMNALQKGIQIGLSRGEAQGIQIGEARGRMNMLFSLVGDGTLSIAAAAKKANMGEGEFKAKMLEHDSPEDS